MFLHFTATQIREEPGGGTREADFTGMFISSVRALSTFNRTAYLRTPTSQESTGLLETSGLPAHTSTASPWRPTIPQARAEHDDLLPPEEQGKVLDNQRCQEKGEAEEGSSAEQAQQDARAQFRQEGIRGRFSKVHD